MFPRLPDSAPQDRPRLRHIGRLSTRKSIVASAKIGILERHGYSPEAYFLLPVHCWLENYYRPMQRRFDTFLERQGASDEAMAIDEAEQYEITLYEKYRDY